MTSPIHFCSQCGTRTSLTIPPGDNLPRFVCEACQHIHYQNPKIVVGTISTWEDQVLLCRRAIEPGYGRWTLPGGFMEEDETVEQGAMRETIEESGAEIDITTLYSVYSIPHINQVHMMFRANMCNSNFAAGEESLAVKLFRHNEIPWNELAFRVIRATMKHYVDDFNQNNDSVHVGTILPASKRPPTSQS